MKVVTRFAPSPTGKLHTGSARTAYFNYLFAKRYGGKFLIRIEDTDQERSKQEYVDSILTDLEWLGLNHDGEIFIQSTHAPSHAAAAHKLLEIGKAYKCYSSIEEIENFRTQNPNEKFHSPWRDSNKTPPADEKPVIRLKVDHEGSTTVHDKVLGEVTVNNKELDDLVLLRSDGTPTYNLSVVVDDHEMGVTHVIRGDDHFTNTFRQIQIFNALGYQLPEFAHIPLIHDEHGKKLSKRSGAMGIDEYKSQGYPNDAVLNHLLRLGFSYNDEEFFTKEHAIEVFNLEHVGKSPARFDIQKLHHISALHIKSMDADALFELITSILLPEKSNININPHINLKMALTLQGLIDRPEHVRYAAIDLIKERSNTLIELIEGLEIFVGRCPEPDEKSENILEMTDRETIEAIVNHIYNIQSFKTDDLKASYTALANDIGIKFPLTMQVLRAVLLGTFNSPAIFDVMEILGKNECLHRIEQAGYNKPQDSYDNATTASY